MNEDGGRWQAVDPQDRDGVCDHERPYVGQDTAVTICLLCGADVEPVLAEVLDLTSGEKGLFGPERGDGDCRQCLADRETGRGPQRSVATKLTDLKASTRWTVVRAARRQR